MPKRLTAWSPCFLLLLVPTPAGTSAAQEPARVPARTLTIYLARHGQTDWNVAGRSQGGTDTPLNATGRQQAAMLKERLAGVRLDAVYSSTLSRSRETAEIVRGETPLSSLAGLSERSFGRFEGRLSSDPVTGPEFLKRRWDPDDTLDGGESLNGFSARVQSAVDAIRTQHPSGAILVVGHGGTNQMILRSLLGLDFAQVRTISQDNDELYAIELQAGTGPRLWKLITARNLGDL